MPQVRHYVVDVHVQATVSTGIGEDMELMHGDALEQVLSQLRQIRCLDIGRASVTETTIGGTPKLRGTS